MKPKSPRKLFQAIEERVRIHQDIVDNSNVIYGLHTAFESLCWGLPSGGDVQQSLHANSMREGARRMIEEFLTLAEQQPEPTRDPAELETELEEPTEEGK